MAGTDGEEDEAAWRGVAYRHGVLRHGRWFGSKGSAGVGTGLCFPLVEAGEGGVIPLFVLESWSDRNWSSSGVQPASSSGSLVLILVLVLPAHVGTLMDPAANLGAEGRAGPGASRRSDGLILAR